MRPDNYKQFDYEAVTICMNDDKQVLITNELVDDVFHYVIYAGNRGQRRPLQSDGVTRHWAEGPVTLQLIDVTKYYGDALNTARLLCGWNWEQDKIDEAEALEAQRVWEEDMREDARQVMAEQQEELRQIIERNKGEI